MNPKKKGQIPCGQGLMAFPDVPETISTISFKGSLE
jgi:hypothetical protein